MDGIEQGRGRNPARLLAGASWPAKAIRGDGKHGHPVRHLGDVGVVMPQGHRVDSEYSVRVLSDQDGGLLFAENVARSNSVVQD